MHWPTRWPNFALGTWAVPDASDPTKAKTVIDMFDTAPEYFYQFDLKSRWNGSNFPGWVTRGDPPFQSNLSKAFHVELQAIFGPGIYSWAVDPCAIATQGNSAGGLLNCGPTSPYVSTELSQPRVEPGKTEPPLACGGGRTDHALFLDVHGECDRRPNGYFVALILRPCLDSVCSGRADLFGLVELASAEKYGRSFARFQQDFRNRNGTRNYSFQGIQEHAMPDGVTHKFYFEPPSRMTWAIQQSNDPLIAGFAGKQFDQWPRTDGGLLTKDGAGRIIVKSPNSSDQIELDYTVAAQPVCRVSGNRCH